MGWFEVYPTLSMAGSRECCTMVPMSERSEREVHILLTVSFPQALLDRIGAVSPEIKLHSNPAREAKVIPEDLLNKVEVLYTADVLPEPDQVPKLRWIQMHYAGVDHISGNPLLSEDIMVTTVSGASAPQMAEFALMSMLALGHRMPEVLRSSPAEQWAEGRYSRFQPLELRDSTVGIVGYGSIGREIARLCVQFGAHILATKHDLMHLEDPGYVPDGLGDPAADLPDRLYPPEALRSMAKLCDFIVVTVPLTPATQGMLNGEVLKAMKPTAYLVDVSRGGVIDHGALVEALNARHLAGAALDVYPIEPLPESSPLWKMKNVLLSPHLAGSSPHYLERAAELFSVNLQRYLTDRPLLNIYDAERGY
jgi:phosphoglycerate dehydrogenase-like enzyme